MSIAGNWVKQIVIDTFPELYAGGQSCRKKNVSGGSDEWSEHSWFNALDLTMAKYGYSSNPNNQAYLAVVADWLWAHREALSIKDMFFMGHSYRTGNTRLSIGHYDHIHVDFWPEGYGTPPCAGGTLQMRYSNGKIVLGDPGPENGMNEVNDPRPTPPPTPPTETGSIYDMDTLSIGAGTKSAGLAHLRSQVRALQIMLAHHGFADQKTADDNCAADGWFGQGTDAAVRAFQRSRGLEADGIVGRLTWAALSVA